MKFRAGTFARTARLVQETLSCSLLRFSLYKFLVGLSPTRPTLFDDVFFVGKGCFVVMDVVMVWLFVFGCLWHPGCGIGFLGNAEGW